jgi:putative membrane protein
VIKPANSNSSETKGQGVSWKQAGGFVGCGLLVGGADAVPGVSGGTVALLLGIYARLVQALSRVDGTLLRHLRSGEWNQAIAYLDLKFLVPLGLGIGTGILLLGRMMHFLLHSDVYRPPTLAVMLGLIFASAIELGFSLRCRSAAHAAGLFAIGLVGAVVAWLLTGTTGQPLQPSYLYLFFCGSIAICAMILPGISGAYLLVILGVYFYVTEIIKKLPEGATTSTDLMSVAVFALGAAIGLLLFTKALKKLLSTASNATLAVMVGFMLGALRKLWPFQEYEGDPKLGNVDYLSPFAVSPTMLAVTVLLIVLSIAVVIVGRKFLPAASLTDEVDSSTTESISSEKS